MSQTILASAVCPECEDSIAIERAPLCGEIIPCATCGAELEVVCADPIRLETAPEVEEDWGE